LAFRWALEQGEVDAAARLASNVGDVARMILREEAAGWPAEVLDLARAHRHPRLILLLTWACSTAWAFQRIAEARRYGEDALALLADPAYEPFVWAYADLAMVALYEGDLAGAVSFVKTGADHAADARDRFNLACVPYFLAVTDRAEQALEIVDT